MNRFGLYATGLFVSVICLTSCLEGGNVSEGWACGVLGYSSKDMNRVLKTGMADFYSTSLNSAEMFDGDCYLFNYRLDGDSPDNTANVIETRGYYTITISWIAQLTKYYITPYVDVSTILPNETPVVKAYFDSEYVDNHWFIYHIVNQSNGTELKWELSYDANTMMPTVEDDGRRYYDLYLRATVTKEGDNTPKVETQHLNAYHMSGYLLNAANIEKSLLGSNYSSSSSNFTVRFKYASNIDMENNTITWQSDQIDIPIAMFLP